MTRSRLLVIFALAVAGIGLLGAAGALLLSPARAAVGPLPAEGLALPADTRFVMGVDVKRFAASPFYQRYASREKATRPEAFKELEERTGLDPERDVDRVIVAGQGGKDAGVILVQGRFDQYKLGREIETRKKGVSTRKHEGRTLYLFNEGEGNKAGAAAFLDDDTIVLGSPSAVEATITSHARGGQSLRTNTALVDLLGRVKPGSTFWMVGDQTLLANMPRSLPAPGGAGGRPGTGATVELPALRALVVTGDLDPIVSLEMTGDAADDAAARNLADVVRGFVALVTLQARQKPELKDLASAVSVSTEQNRVHVSARVPYELLDSLQTTPSRPVAPAPRTQ